MKPLRILYMANAPWCGTGYGTQSNSLLPRLSRLDSVDDAAMFAFYGVQGGITRQHIGNEQAGYMDLTCYPLKADMWGNDIVTTWAHDFKADLIVTLVDIWVLDVVQYGASGFYWLPWMPIDHDPVPPDVLEHCKAAYLPLTYTRFAEKELWRNGVENAYIPHGIESQVFEPLPQDEREKCKEMLGFPPDCFLVGCVGANKGWPDRKGFQWLFEAFQRFSSRHEKARLYVHSIVERIYGGPDLVGMARVSGIAEQTRFPMPNKVLLNCPTEWMVRMYNAFDVFCLPTMGEGFGIPLLEAQACGCPVITTDFAGGAELARETGWLVPLAAKFMTPLLSWQAVPSVEGLEICLDAAYDDAKNPLRRQRAREFSLQYDWDEVAQKQWTPLLAELAERIEPKTIRREPCLTQPMSLQPELVAST